MSSVRDDLGPAVSGIEGERLLAPEPPIGSFDAFAAAVTVPAKSVPASLALLRDELVLLEADGDEDGERLAPRPSDGLMDPGDSSEICRAQGRGRE